MILLLSNGLCMFAAFDCVDAFPDDDENFVKVPPLPELQVVLKVPPDVKLCDVSLA